MDQLRQIRAAVVIVCGSCYKLVRQSLYPWRCKIWLGLAVQHRQDWYAIGKIRAMAGADERTHGGAALALAEIREPLLPRLSQNIDNDGSYVKDQPYLHPTKSQAPQPHPPFLFERSRSTSPRSVSSGVEDHADQSAEGDPQLGSDRLEMSSLTAENSNAPSESSEIQLLVEDSVSEGGRSFFSTDVEDFENLMQLKLEAMTWAAMAKDFTISSLEKRLRKALQIAKAEQMKNKELQSGLNQSRQRQTSLGQELLTAREQITKLVQAEERLSRELGYAEADAAQQDAQHRSQLHLLADRLKAQDQYIQRVLSQMEYNSWPVRDVEVLEQELERLTEGEKNLREKFFEAEQEMEQTTASLKHKLLEAEEEVEELRRELNETNSDLRVSEALRRTQFKRLKVLEKERRHLVRRGALRTVKLAPRTQKKVEPTPPGGRGWNVFSVLDFPESSAEIVD